MSPLFQELFGELRSLVNGYDTSRHQRIPVLLYQKGVPYTKESAEEMQEIVQYLQAYKVALSFEAVKSLLEIKDDWSWGEPLPENNPYKALLALVEDPRTQIYQTN